MKPDQQAVISKLGWRFDHQYAHQWPTLVTPQRPVPVADPQLILFNENLAKQLGLASFQTAEADWIAQLSGNQPDPGSNPVAQAYAGHQFGHFTMLGDGRALLMGEQLAPDGTRWDIQWKGSGPTPYSRRGDGRATLTAMLREYIMSEALHALGIPSTRSLAVVATGEPVYRALVQPGAILTRVAASHIRVGTFEYIRHFHTESVLQSFTHYVINRHYPALTAHDRPVLAFLEAVMDRQIALIVHWMRVGFVHGVMNTDNMSIAGETIDYGPCAFLDHYHPATVFSSIDTGGRYAFDRQAAIAQWNLAVFATTLLPQIEQETGDGAAAIKDLLNAYARKYKDQWWQMMGRKLGFTDLQDASSGLVTQLLQWMQTAQADFTYTFYLLTRQTFPEESIYQQASFQQWYQAWQEQLQLAGIPFDQIQSVMAAVNPVYIPRNHIVESVLDAANRGDIQPLKAALSIWQDPYVLQTQTDPYLYPPAQVNKDYQTFCGT
jgi:serine/tyrosine/threonine adenylyltransferase